MADSLASFITLSAFILSALIISIRSRNFSGNGIAMSLLNAALCCIGGFLLTALAMKVSGGIDNQLITSTLVVAGSLICVAAKETLGARKKTTN